MSKALLIDAAARAIREIDMPEGVKPHYEALRRHIGGWIECAFQWPNHDTLYVDEEFLLKRPLTEHWFRFLPRPHPQPLGGNGVVVGREIEDRDGEMVGMADVIITAEQLAPLVQWMTLQQAEAWARGNASEPASGLSWIDHDGRVRSDVRGRYGEVFGVAAPQSRAEHLAWAKRRALEYLDRGDLEGAFASLISDLSKHAATQDLMSAADGLGMADGLRLVADGNAAGLRALIVGLK